MLWQLVEAHHHLVENIDYNNFLIYVTLIEEIYIFFNLVIEITSLYEGHFVYGISMSLHDIYQKFKSY
jgi:hypothetical protein